MKYCVKCGNPLDDGDLFCSKCGAPVSDATATASAAAEAASAQELMARENAPYLKSYLDGAKELEWNRYELQQIRDRLKEKLREAENDKASLEREIEMAGSVGHVLPSENLKDRQKARASYDNDDLAQDSSENRRTRFFTVFAIWDALILVSWLVQSVFMGKGSALSWFVETGKKLGVGWFISVLFVFIGMPAIISWILGAIGKALEKRHDIAARAQRLKEEQEAEAEEKKRKQQQLLQESIRRTRILNETKAKLEPQIRQYDAVILPQLEQEVKDNKAALQRTEASLKKYYEPNIVYFKYRGLVPVTAFAEYFDSQRCYELIGPDGAYNLYENELMLNSISAKLDNIQEGLNYLASQHDEIVSALREMNTNVTDLISSVDDAQRENIEMLEQIEDGTKQLAQSAKLQEYYQKSANRALYHLEYMQGTDFIQRHLLKELANK